MRRSSGAWVPRRRTTEAAVASVRLRLRLAATRLGAFHPAASRWDQPVEAVAGDTGTGPRRVLRVLGPTVRPRAIMGAARPGRSLICGNPLCSRGRPAGMVGTVDRPVTAVKTVARAHLITALRAAVRDRPVTVPRVAVRKRPVTGPRAAADERPVTVLQATVVGRAAHRVPAEVAVEVGAGTPREVVAGAVPAAAAGTRPVVAARPWYHKSV